MKFATRIAAVLLVALSSAAFAQKPVLSVIAEQLQSQRGALSSAREQRGGNVEIAFVEGETAVVGLQFDLKIRDAAGAVSACGSLPSGHSVTCNDIASDTLRVIVFSVENAPIETGVLVAFPSAGVAKIVEGSVQMGDANAQAVEPEVL